MQRPIQGQANRQSNTQKQCSLLCALAGNRGKNFKRKQPLQVGGSFFTLLPPVIAGLVSSILQEMAKRYSISSIELTLSLKEHFEENLSNFIYSETISDDKKLLLLHDAIR